MWKNIVITFLAISLIVMILLYFFIPGTGFSDSGSLIKTDTVYLTDTIYREKAADKNAEHLIKGGNPPREPEKRKDTVNPYKDVALSYRIIPSENSTFGYEILMDGRLYIRQPNIPGLPGNEGFLEKITAMKVADLVILKIRKNEMPPSVTVEELKNLNALK